VCAVSESKKQTWPVDYAPLLSNAPEDEHPVIVGGQAVNLWLLTFFPERLKTSYGSFDMDILATPKILRWMAEQPDWKYVSYGGTVRQAGLEKTAPDGRTLRVEALVKVFGLDTGDLQSLVELEHQGMRFVTLDPVALIKAKCANVNELAQGDELRHDEEHLKLLGQIMPEYLREVHGQAHERKLREETVTNTLGRLFKVMQTPATAGVLWHAGLTADGLVPVECQNSPSAVMRAQCDANMPACRVAINADNYNPERERIKRKDPGDGTTLNRPLLSPHLNLNFQLKLKLVWLISPSIPSP
jgi:hypothetical protein